jgi:hypothetical protein
MAEMSEKEFRSLYFKMINEYLRSRWFKQIAKWSKEVHWRLWWGQHHERKIQQNWDSLKI